MRSGKEKYVKIKHPLPVLITYFTAWVNNGDSLNFREDVYGHDGVMAKKMFLDAVPTTKLKPSPKINPAKKDTIPPKKAVVPKPVKAPENKKDSIGEPVKD